MSCLFSSSCIFSRDLLYIWDTFPNFTYFCIWLFLMHPLVFDYTKLVKHYLFTLRHFQKTLSLFFIILIIFVHVCAIACLSSRTRMANLSFLKRARQTIHVIDFVGYVVSPVTTLLYYYTMKAALKVCK